MPISDLFIISAAVFWYCWRLRRRWRSILIGPVVLLGTFVSTGYAGYCVWYAHRPLPEPLSRQLAPGVSYVREVRLSPRPMVIHVVAIDLESCKWNLRDPGGFNAGRKMLARTTSQFAREFHTQVAINASFFYPQNYHNPWDYYPHPGDPCDLCGESVSEGVKISRPGADFHTLYITKDNGATIGNTLEGAWNAVSGRDILLSNGEIDPQLSDRSELMPETAVAIDRPGKKMYWIVIDGRQPGYSEGVTLGELAAICKVFGGWTALVHGGGSSTLVAASADSDPEGLNCPIHDRHPPGRQRPVANHLGLRVRPD